MSMLSPGCWVSTGIEVLLRTTVRSCGPMEKCVFDGNDISIGVIVGNINGFALSLSCTL